MLHRNLTFYEYYLTGSRLDNVDFNLTYRNRGATLEDKQAATLDDAFLPDKTLTTQANQLIEQRPNRDVLESPTISKYVIPARHKKATRYTI